MTGTVSSSRALRGQCPATSLILINVNLTSGAYFAAVDGRLKMVDRNANHALINAYLNSIRHYQKLLRTHLTEVEQDYIKERLSAYNAALKALIGSEITIWEPSHVA
jgi:hypothetical protein